jgi:ribosome-binding protein aMBF1 (putative translation factor)
MLTGPEQHSFYRVSSKRQKQPLMTPLQPPSTDSLHLTKNNTNVIIPHMHDKDKMNLIRHEDVMAELMKDPEFRKGYEDLEFEFQVVAAMIDYREKHDLTQKEFAERMGMKQSAIARFERGPGNPTTKFLKRLANGMGMKLVISLRERA